MNKVLAMEILTTVFDALPSFVFVVDHDVKIEEYNAAASDFFSLGKVTVVKQRAGEMLSCVHSIETPGGCGHAPECRNCPIRNAVGEAFNGHRVVRHHARLEMIRNGGKTEMFALITASPFTFEGGPLVLLIIEDFSEIAELHRMIPICSICKKVRDDKDAWLRVEAYFKDNWDLDFTHSYCPECYEAAKAINALTHTPPSQSSQSPI